MGMALEKSPLQCPKISWTLVNKRLEMGPPFYSPSVKICILFHC